MFVALHLARWLVQQAALILLHCPRSLVTSSFTGRAGDFTVTSPGLSKNALAVGATQVGMQAAGSGRWSRVGLFSVAKGRRCPLKGAC